MKVSERLAPALRRGALAFVALAVLTALEYIVAVAVVPGATPWLALLMAGKAWVILHTFMHILQLWREEEP